MRAACELQLASNELAKLASGEELEMPEKELAHDLFAERHRERIAFLRRHVRLHVDPPVALGSGHRALVHKVSGQTFKRHLQGPPEMPLKGVAITYRAPSADLGTERLTCTCNWGDDSHEASLPEWVSRSALASGVAVPSEATSQQGPCAGVFDAGVGH